MIHTGQYAIFGPTGSQQSVNVGRGSAGTQPRGVFPAKLPLKQVYSQHRRCSMASAVGKMDARPSDAGALKRREGVEKDLLNHVVTTATKGDAQSVLNAIDDFCWNQHWMMNIGDEKGKALDKGIALANENTPGGVKVAVELGLYCGYSAVRIASQIASNGKLYSIEPAELHRSIAAAVIEHAGLSHKVEILPGTAAEVAPSLREVVPGLQYIDLLFVDHIKDLYLPDLQSIENAGLLRSGSVVVSDNVVFFGLDDYLGYLRSSGRYKSNELHRGLLEYSKAGEDAKVDGVDISVYA